MIRLLLSPFFHSWVCCNSSWADWIWYGGALVTFNHPSLWISFWEASTVNSKTFCQVESSHFDSKDVPCGLLFSSICAAVNCKCSTLDVCNVISFLNPSLVFWSGSWSGLILACWVWSILLAWSSWSSFWQHCCWARSSCCQTLTRPLDTVDVLTEPCLFFWAK